MTKTTKESKEINEQIFTLIESRFENLRESIIKALNIPNGEHKTTKELILFYLNWVRKDSNLSLSYCVVCSKDILEKEILTDLGNFNDSICKKCENKKEAKSLLGLE